MAFLQACRVQLITKTVIAPLLPKFKHVSQNGFELKLEGTIYGSTCLIQSVKMGSILNLEANTISVTKVRLVGVKLFLKFSISKTTVRNSAHRRQH